MSSCFTFTQPSSHSLFRNYFTLTSGVYKRLGQFDYGQPNCTTNHIKTCIHWDNKWIYIGELKEGTDDTPHGIGIQVWKGGDIKEGYWKDWEQHGRGRFIDSDGSYYIGEFKEDKWDGEGTRYYKDGDIKYEGGWKGNFYYGQGTYYKDGNKYTGQWDGSKGKGEINYKDGTKYIGEWDYLDDANEKYNYNYRRHGLGALYSADGQVLNQGKWEKDEYKGKE